jgi:predicted HAD superfamily Cof-like phosphohydrolase
MPSFSNSQLVKSFTEESMACTLPTKPIKMTKDEVRFITRMVFSEFAELCATVTNSSEECDDLLQDCLDTIDKPKIKNYDQEEELIADQYDSFVDAWYYMLNCSCKKGVDLDKIFNVVHQANMNKRFPDGSFHRREDGKVLKPEDWKEPDVVQEIKRQMDN